MSTLIQVFAKAPILGKVKTRLARDIGDVAALQTYKKLCKAVITSTQACQADHIEIWTTENPQSSEATRFFDAFSVSVCEQQGEDLGARMRFSLKHGFQQHSMVVVVGADAYSLNSEYLDLALATLDDVDVVIGPALDGGYILIGMSQFVPAIFERISWGSDRVLSETVSILKTLPVSFSLLPDRWDIDTLEDVKRFAPNLVD